MRRAVPLVLMCVAATLWVGCSSEESVGDASYGWNLIVRFDGITYAVSEGQESGRPLREDDLGAKFAEVRHDVSDEGPGYRVEDGDAAYLKAGPPVYEVAGTIPLSAWPPCIGAT